MIKDIRAFRYIFLYLLLHCPTWRASDALFVPEEVPSLLSFVYNNIPPFAKGTDSRVGVGFRLGPNADFQMLFELGPQKETQTLPPIRGYETSRKRHVPTSAWQTERPRWQQDADADAARTPFQIRHPGTPDGWLSAWRDALNSKRLAFESERNRRPTPHAYHNGPSYKTVQHLRQLYRERPA